MRKTLQIEDIEEMRRRAGIDDVELREAIRGLRAGDYVRLTFLTGTKSSRGKTLLVRVTRIRGSEFRGRPAAAGPLGLSAGVSIAFRAAHIHSLANGRSRHAR
jgi:hypothetical protein